MMEKNFYLKEEALGLILKIRAVEPGSIALDVVKIGSALLSVLSKAGQHTLFGKEVSRVFSEDQSACDEWIEFVLRTCRMPLAEEVSTGSVTHMLQCLTVLDGWYVTRIDCSADCAYVKISFTDVADFEQKALVRQQMALRQFWTIRRKLNNEGSWVVDWKTKQLLISGKAASMFGLGERAQILAFEDFKERMYEEDVPKVLEALKNAMKGGTACYHRAVLNNGEILYLRSTISSVFNREGEVVQFYGFVENVTVKPYDRKGLSEERRRLEHIAKNTQMYVLTLNRDGAYTYASENVAKLSGVALEEVIGGPIGKLAYPGEDSEQALAEIGVLIRSGATGKVKCRMKTAAGGYRWYLFTLFTLLNDNAVPEVFSIGQDITDEKKREEKLAYLNKYDNLTNTLNRSAFMRRLQELYDAGIWDYCIVLFDINGLRLINDVYGHYSGDKLLIEVANIVKYNFREKSEVARIGGDEYAVIVYGVGEEELQSACEGAARHFMQLDKHMSVSLSWGIVCQKKMTLNVKELFREAESRMFSNKVLKKSSMRNQVLSSLEEVLKLRNMETSEHMTRMEMKLYTLGKEMNLSGNEMDKLRLLACMHDVGKLCIPDEVMNKPGPLDISPPRENEWESHGKYEAAFGNRYAHRIGITGAVRHCKRNPVPP